jgi:hypothetical protein
MALAVWSCQGIRTVDLQMDWLINITKKEAAIEHFAKNVRQLPLERLGKPEEVATCNRISCF